MSEMFSHPWLCVCVSLERFCLLRVLPGVRIWLAILDVLPGAWWSSAISSHIAYTASLHSLRNKLYLEMCAAASPSEVPLPPRDTGDLPVDLLRRLRSLLHARSPVNS